MSYWWPFSQRRSRAQVFLTLRVVGGTNMVSLRYNLRRFLGVCIVVCAGVGGLFALALLTAAFSKDGLIGSILLGGFGFILLGLSVLGVVLGSRLWKLSKPD